MQHGLEKKVTQFLTDQFGITLRDRLGDLVSLFQQMRNQALMSLLTIPRTTSWCTQLMNDGSKACDGVS
jgi:hypothetical protein